MMKSSIAKILPYMLLALVILIFPVLGLFLTIPFYFLARKGKKIIILSVLLGILVGYFAYNFVPSSSFDLIHWHQVVDCYSNVDNLNGFIAVSDKLDLEIIPKIFSFIVAQTGNNNLLQFIIVAIGYSALFYILADYKTKIKMKNQYFIPIFIMMLFGQTTLYYFSGLYNYIAINLFALGFYLDYIKHQKILPWICYIIPALTHNSMFLPLILLVAYKLLGNKMSIRFVIFAILVPVLFVGAVNTFADALSIFGLSSIRNLLNMYLSDNEHFSIFYSGFILLIDIIKILIAIILCLILRKRINEKPYYGFAVSVGIITIPLTLISIVMIRFATLALFLSIVPIMDAIQLQKGKKKLIYFIATTMIAALFAGYNIHAVYPYGYRNGFILRKIPSTITEFFNSNE